MPIEHWPEPRATQALIDQLYITYEGPSSFWYTNLTYVDSMVPYAVTGDYLTMSASPFTNFDAQGLPQSEYYGTDYYNPVTIARFVLNQHGKYVKGDNAALSKMVLAADKLLALQDAGGGFPYPYTHGTPPRSLQPGWLSAMAQGLALSAFSRAYLTTGAGKYLTAGEAAYVRLSIPIGNGGLRGSMADLDPTLSGYVFFPEYPYAKLDYTLNGYMFTLLGLYDWSKLANASSKDAAGVDFQDGLRTLERIIPYYDFGGYSMYDLSFITHNQPLTSPNYQPVHLELLHALNCIVSSPVLKYYEATWLRRIQAMNARLRIVTANYSATTVKVGAQISVSIGVAGGNGAAVSYKFMVKKNGGSWSILQDWSADNSVVWAPPNSPGDWTFALFVKNVNSPDAYDHTRNQPITVVP